MLVIFDKHVVENEDKGWREVGEAVEEVADIGDEEGLTQQWNLWKVAAI